MNLDEARRALQDLYDQMQEERDYQRSVEGHGLDAAFVNAQMLGVRLAADELGISLTSLNEGGNS